MWTRLPSVVADRHDVVEGPVAQGVEGLRFVIRDVKAKFVHDLNRTRTDLGFFYACTVDGILVSVAGMKKPPAIWGRAKLWVHRKRTLSRSMAGFWGNCNMMNETTLVPCGTVGLLSVGWCDRWLTRAGFEDIKPRILIASISYERP